MLAFVIVAGWSGQQGSAFSIEKIILTLEFSNNSRLPTFWYTATDGVRDIGTKICRGRHKGSRRLLELARQARLLRPDLRFQVVGYTDIDEELRALENVTITGPYQPEDLGRLLNETNGRVALFLHEWPETFSYTLTEAWSAGLWPIVPRLGAPAERVIDKRNGSILDDVELMALVDVLEQVNETFSGPLLPNWRPLGADLPEPIDGDSLGRDRVVWLSNRRAPG